MAKATSRARSTHSRSRRSDLKLASLRRDREWVERAREVAFAIVDSEGGLEAHADLLDEVALFLDEDDQEFLLKG